MTPELLHSKKEMKVVTITDNSANVKYISKIIKNI